MLEDELPAEEPDKEVISKADAFQAANDLIGSDCRIATTYQIVTPESAEQGDYAESGWEDEEGESVEPDEFDDEGTTVVDKAVKWLLDKGAIEASSSSFHSDVWYTSAEDINYSTGSFTTYNFHLRGFTPEEQEAVFDVFNAQRRLR